MNLIEMVKNYRRNIKAEKELREALDRYPSGSMRDDLLVAMQASDDYWKHNRNSRSDHYLMVARIGR